MLDVSRPWEFWAQTPCPNQQPKKQKRSQVAEDNLTLESELVVRILSLVCLRIWDLTDISFCKELMNLGNSY